MCQSITFGNGNPAPCGQDSAQDSSLDLCYYHEKMSKGYITPQVEGVSVKTASGVSIYSQTRNVRK